MSRNLFLFAALLLALASPGVLGQTQNETSTNGASSANEAVRDGYKRRTTAFTFANVSAPIAGLAAGLDWFRLACPRWLC